jgi:hypothetical protein
MHIRQLCFKLLAATFLLLLALASGAEPLGMVTDLTGKVWAVAGATRKPLSILAYLEQGTIIEIEAGGRISITYFNPPDEYVFSAAAQFQMMPKAPRMISGAAPTVKRLNSMAADAALQERSSGRRTQAAIRMRSVGSVSGLSPNMTTLRTAPTRLSWTALPNVSAYRVKMFDAGGAVLLQEETRAQAEWVLPAGIKLEPGKEYAWEVEATLASGSVIAGRGRFNLLAADLAKRLNDESPVGEATFAQRLRHAMTLESLGVSEEANALWKELARERPDEPMLQKRVRH